MTKFTKYFSEADTELCQCFNVDVGTMVINDKLRTCETITDADVSLIGTDLWHFEPINRSGQNVLAQTAQGLRQDRKQEQSERAAKMAAMFHKDFDFSRMEAEGLSVTDLLDAPKHVQM